MKKQSITQFLVSTLLAASCITASAQVTIRSNIEPHPGALLDLKETDSEGGNSTKGILLPRVALTDGADLFPCADTESESEAHIGLTIYNVTKDYYNKVCPGIHVWDGIQWKALKEQEYDFECNRLIDLEGNTYMARLFGKAGCWMTQNIRSTRNNIVTLEENRNTSSQAQKLYYYYPGGSPSIMTTNPEYGLVYTGYAANGGRSLIGSDQGGKDHRTYQGICPEGWHLPSDKEWSELEEAIINDFSEYSISASVTPWDPEWAKISLNRGNHAKTMMSQTWVNNTDPEGESLAAGYGTGGFDALLVGAIGSGTPGNYGTQTAFWSTSPTGSNNVGYMRQFLINTEYPRRVAGGDWLLYSVRCKKNECD